MPIKRPALGWMLSNVDQLVVFSRLERSLYAKAFDLPEAHFQMIHWGVNPPNVDSPEDPLEQGEYVCAIGGNARDYGTLLEAARLTPHIRFVCVVRPNSLRGLDIPSNVTVHTNLPSGHGHEHTSAFAIHGSSTIALRSPMRSCYDRCGDAPGQSISYHGLGGCS